MQSLRHEFSTDAHQQARLVRGTGRFVPAGCKPTDNAFIEASNGRFCAECLNAHWCMSLEDAREKLEDWCKYYNDVRPHGAIGQNPQSRC